MAELRYFDTREQGIKFEKVEDNEKQIVGNPYFNYNSYGKESVGRICGFTKTSDGKFDLKYTPNTPEHNGTGRYCYNYKWELNYDVISVRDLIGALWTEGRKPFESAQNVRAFCENHPEFQTAQNTYMFKITDDSPYKGGYFEKENSGRFGWEGCVTFFTVTLKDDSPEVKIQANSFITDLFYPYLNVSDRGISLQGRDGKEQYRIKNGTEIQLTDEHGHAEQYSCYLYDTRTLYDIDNELQPNMFVIMSEEEMNLNLKDVSECDKFRYAGKPYSCSNFLFAVVDDNKLKASVRTSGLIDTDKLKEKYETIKIPRNKTKLFVSKYDHNPDGSKGHFLYVYVPNDDPSDRRYERTFTVNEFDKTDKDHEIRLFKNCNDNKYIKIKIPIGQTITLDRSTKIGDGQYSHEKSECTVEYIKNKFKEKPDLKKDVYQKSEKAKQTPYKTVASSQNQNR